MLTGADGAVHAIVLAGEEEDGPPHTVRVPSVRPGAGAGIRRHGSDISLTWKKTGNDIAVMIPDGLREDPPCRHAWVLRIPVTE